MKLSYRGIEYNQKSNLVNVHYGSIAGKYRGANWQEHNLDKIPVKQSHSHLTYRGVSYN
ncbi:MAG: DUF4278 domain-containing protein [Xenococcus sp. (in: cyanobacteria)]